MEIKFLKKKKNFTKGDLNTKPDLYWRYILYMTFTLIFASFAFGLYLFIKINKESNLPVINTDEQKTIKKERIDKVLEYFEERKNKSIEILNSPSPIIDPSL
ncbi:hypothetical protein A3B84_00645 [Candidatus Nomurabacteria bacterium RIFCSPHIGHO2_02_FULL_35_13]|uniref:Uncharacterized protein n=1 Tax=Candidatus Nomurabacteria bacterium RIFCSPHIGHO2_02_FULL_35_13 TaxID=1801748 RepID=A0A1F6VNY8_9BACT|nr:MAG: hypothetical protein A3B84_00645 [Candidatus Nomurabacteria bacterium RIFCSPHIGHO2_02_FULL_35_13]